MVLKKQQIGKIERVKADAWTWTRCAQLSLLFFLSVLLSNAQENQDTIKLKAATVESFFKPAESLHSQSIEPMEVIELGSLTIGEALQNQSAIQINSYGNSGVQAISFRGTGANQTQVYWNGFNVNSPTLGQADLSIFPSTGLSSIQVHSGLTSLIDGSGGLGGSIHLENDLQFDKGLKGLISTQLASFHNYSGLANIQWSNEKLSNFTSLSYQSSLNDFTYKEPNSGTYSNHTNENAEFERTNLTQGLAYRLNEKNTLKAFLWWNDNKRYIPDLITNLAGVSDTLFDSALRTSLAWKHFRDKSSHEIIVAYFDDRQEFHSYSLYKYHFKNSHIAYRNVNYLANDVRIKTSIGYHLNKIQSGGFVGDVSQERLDAMVNFNMPLGKKLELDMIVRFEVIAGKYTSGMPMASIMYKPFSNTVISASSGRSYRYPSLNDLYWSPGGNPDLQSEEGWSHELGLKWTRQERKTSKGNRLNLGINYFSSSIDNWILWSPEDNYWSPENLYHVKNSGLEAFAESKITLGANTSMSVNIKYSYTDSKNTESDIEGDKSINKQLIYVPFHLANGKLKFEHKKIGFEYHYYFVSKRFIHRDHSAWMPYYMISGLSGFASIGENFSLNVSVNNLLDKNYQVMPHRPMQGRNYSVRITYRFNQSKTSE